MPLPDIELVSAKVHEGEELMVPYDQLSEDVKDLDRGTVKAVYAALEAIQQ